MPEVVIIDKPSAGSLQSGDEFPLWRGDALTGRQYRSTLSNLIQALKSDFYTEAEIDELFSINDVGADNFTPYDPLYSYIGGVTYYVKYLGTIWKFISDTTQIGVAPDSDPLIWDPVNVGEFAHEVNKDSKLAEDTDDEVTAAELRLFLDSAGLAGGYIPLNGSGKIDDQYMPDLSIVQYLGEVADETAMLALDGQYGDWCIRQDNDKVYVITGPDPTLSGDWRALSYPGAGISGTGLANRVTYWTGTGSMSYAAVTLTELEYLSGVTSGIQAQLNGKANLSGATFTGAISAPEFKQGATTIITTGGVLQNVSGNISLWTNDTGYITTAALSGYATQSWVNSQGFLTSHPNTSGLSGTYNSGNVIDSITVDADGHVTAIGTNTLATGGSVGNLQQVTDINNSTDKGINVTTLPSGNSSAAYRLAIPNTGSYNAIRSDSGAAGGGTIHFFGSLWSSGTDLSRDSINLSGGSGGITFGAWNNPDAAVFTRSSSKYLVVGDQRTDSPWATTNRNIILLNSSSSALIGSHIGGAAVGYLYFQSGQVNINATGSRKVVLAIDSHGEALKAQPNTSLNGTSVGIGTNLGNIGTSDEALTVGAATVNVMTVRNTNNSNSRILFQRSSTPSGGATNLGYIEAITNHIEFFPGLTSNKVSFNQNGAVTASGVGLFNPHTGGVYAKIGDTDYGYYQDSVNGAYRGVNQTTAGFYFQKYNGASTSMYIGLDAVKTIGIGKADLAVSTVNNNALTVIHKDVPGTLTSAEIDSAVSVAGVSIFVPSGSHQGLQSAYVRSNGETFGNTHINYTNGSTYITGATELGGGFFQFRTWDSGDNIVNRFIITSSGNVGIGLDSPSTKLHIENSSTFAPSNALPALLLTGWYGGGLLMLDGSSYGGFYMDNGGARMNVTLKSTAAANNITMYHESSLVTSLKNFKVNTGNYYGSSESVRMNIGTNGAYHSSRLSVNATSVNTSYTFHVTGTAYASTNFSSGSDERIKTPVDYLQDALDKVMQLRPYRYIKYGQLELGFGAQTTYRILPEVVNRPEKSDDLWAIKYDQFTALNTRAIQMIRTEQLSDRERIKALEQKVREQANEIESLKRAAA